MGAVTMYRKGLKPCTGRLSELYLRRSFPLCYSIFPDFSSSSLSKESLYARSLSSQFSRDAHMGLNHLCKVAALLQRRESSFSSQSRRTCQSIDLIPDTTSSSFLLRPQRLLQVQAPKRCLNFPNEGLLRMSGSPPIRWISGEHGTDEKNQVVISPLLGGGGENDKAGERVLACDGGGEEDENNVEQSRLHVAASGGEHDERSDEKERLQEGKEDSAFLTKKAQFKKVYEERLVKWEDVQITLEEFPHYLSDTTRDLLIDCAAAHLRQPKYAEYGSGLPSSSRRICLRGPAGTQLHQERLVEALAHHLKASFLVLDSTTLAPYDYGTQELSSSNLDDSDSEASHADSGSECSDDEEEEVSLEKLREGRDFKVDVLLEMAANTVVHNVEAHREQAYLKERIVQGGADEGHHDKSAVWKVKKGDRVKYVGSGSKITSIGDLRGWLRVGQRGHVVLVPKGSHGKVGIEFEKPYCGPDGYNNAQSGMEELQRTEIEWCYCMLPSFKPHQILAPQPLKSENTQLLSGRTTRPQVVFLLRFLESLKAWFGHRLNSVVVTGLEHLSDLEPDDTSPADPAEEWLAAVEALCEMSSPTRPLVVYFPDPRQWFERAVPLEKRQEFLERVEAKLDLIDGPVVLIASRTTEEEGDLDDRARLKAHLEDIRIRLNQRTSTKWIFRELLGSEDVYELFINPIKIYPPEEDEMLLEWKKQLLHDKEISHAKQNLQQLSQILEMHNMECEELPALNLWGLNLTKTKAERVVGWARNHHLGLCLFDPPTSNGKLMIPRDSMERALTRLRDQETKKAPNVVKDFKTVAEDEYEKALISAVIPPHEVGVKFDHIGALENVKNALKELVMLPLQRPELFAKGNLTRPCKGVLLFGPPGTGKTLLAKAVATEAGANFINITGSTITSKWFGDAEKLTKALFSLARKLSPAVIFVDEVDSLLGARGGSSEHEATRKTRNEFMAAWDGLRSKDSERVLVLAATNRPFDLDDAVIRRLPRRILVDLPTTENRVKILRVILADEELAEGFDYEELSRMTDGYSGSDLKNLSIAAAYRPIRELLESEEQQAKSGIPAKTDNNTSQGRSKSLIRPLMLDDFKQAMTQVGASVAFDASSMNELRRWNEQYGEGGNRRKSTFGFAV